jgi:hypothetical protein
MRAKSSATGTSANRQKDFPTDVSGRIAAWAESNGEFA